MNSPLRRAVFLPVKSLGNFSENMIVYLHAPLAPMRLAIGVPTFASGLSMMAYLYILQNKAGRFYIGSTSDLEKRLKHHLGGHTPSTKRLGPMKLVFNQEFALLAEARQMEKWLKKMKRRDYIERIVKDGYIRHKRL
ncbi:MAG: GIY-YIG nuclease family protein [bacterium]|nr:GIY-YIG nuclease family protein [bacterium]